MVITSALAFLFYICDFMLFGCAFNFNSVNSEKRGYALAYAFVIHPFAIGAYQAIFKPKRSL